MTPLFFHQFRKDLRQTWILWIVWLFFTVIQFALAAWDVGASNVIGQGFYSQMAGMVPTIQSLILFILVPALILQEPTVGVSAFWLTRPMPRGTVLKSKLLALLILVLLPTLGQCTVLLAHGVVAWDVVLAGIQIALHELSWIALIMMLATLSPNFTRYLIVAVVLFALQFLGDWLYALAVTVKIANKSGDVFWQLPGLFNSRQVVADLLRIILSISVAFFQYRTRRIRLSIILAAVSVLVVFFAAKVWPWNFLLHSESKVSGTKVDASKIKVTIGWQIICNDIQDMTGGKPKKSFQSVFDCQNDDPSKAVSVSSLGGELTFPNGEKLSLPTQEGATMYYGGGGNLIRSQSLEYALGYLPLINRQDMGRSYQQLFVLNKEDLDKYDGRSGKLTLRVKVQLNSYRVASEWPLSKGAVVSKGSARSTITEILHERIGLKVDLQNRGVKLLLRPSPLEIGANSPKYYILESTNKGEAMAVNSSQQFGNMMNLAMNNRFFAMVFGGISDGANKIENIESQTLVFGPIPYNYPIVDLPITLNDEWLAGAKLLEMELVPSGEFETTVTVDDFRISSQNSNTYQNNNQSEDTNLKGIELPKDPSRSDVWRYILQIMSRDKRSYSSRDPEIDLLVKVGPANADLLLLAMYNNWNSSYDLVYAINKMDLGGTPCKEMVLRYLSEKTDLIEAVIKNHWEAAAKSILVDRISGKSGDAFMPNHWPEALASVRDPSTYPILLNYAKDSFRKSETYRLEQIRAIPGALISSLVGDLWKKVRGKKEEAGIIRTATSWGISDALQRTSEILGSTPNGSKDERGLRDTARDAFRSATACSINLLDSELVVWYTANKAQLTFDPHLGRFLVHARPIVDQQAAWPIPANYMKSLGELAAKGETAAIDDLADALTRLTEGLDPVKDRPRIVSLREIAWNAFNVMRSAAVKDPSVFKVLDYANGKAQLNEFFVPGAYADAATEGNQTAVEALTHYKDHNWSLADALNNLGGAVAKNNPAAVDFVLGVYADPVTASLPNAKEIQKNLINRIKDAANAGNEKAMAIYKDYQKTVK